jgi:hypothetical protein
MARVVAIELEMPADLARFRLPRAVNKRLQALLDRQDEGEPPQQNLWVPSGSGRFPSAW